MRGIVNFGDFGLFKTLRECSRFPIDEAAPSDLLGWTNIEHVAIARALYREIVALVSQTL